MIVPCLDTSCVAEFYISFAHFNNRIGWRGRQRGKILWSPHSAHGQLATFGYLYVLFQVFTQIF